MNDASAKLGYSSPRTFYPKGYREVGSDLVFSEIVDGVAVENAEYDDCLEKTVKALQDLT